MCFSAFEITLKVKLGGAMEMLEHPDISAVMRYGTLEKSGRRGIAFLYGYAYGKEYEEEEDEYDEGYEN